MKIKLRGILDKALQSFCSYQDKVLAFEDPEDVHQMRIKGRELLTYLNLLAGKKQRHAAEFTQLKSSLKASMKSLGVMRDLDIFIQEMDQARQMLPSLAKTLIVWLADLRGEKVKLSLQMARELPALLTPKWEKHMGIWMKKRASKLADQEALWAKLVRLKRKKDRALKAIEQYLKPDIGDEAFLTLIHRARISVKQLRYALKALKNLNAKTKQQRMKRLATLQDQFGDIQNRRVWTAHIRRSYGENWVANELTELWHREMRAKFAQIKEEI